MRKLLCLLLLVVVAGCDTDPGIWNINLPRTGTMATGQVMCELQEITEIQLTVVDPLGGAPYIAEDRAWSCRTADDDSVVCLKTVSGIPGASTFDIVPTRVVWTVFFGDGTACAFYFGG